MTEERQKLIDSENIRRAKLREGKTLIKPSEWPILPLKDVRVGVVRMKSPKT